MPHFIHDIHGQYCPILRSYKIGFQNETTASSLNYPSGLLGPPAGSAETNEKTLKKKIKAFGNIDVSFPVKKSSLFPGGVTGARLTALH